MAKQLREKNPLWKRSSGASRRAETAWNYAHISVAVGWERNPETGEITFKRTPKGKGSTAKRLTPKVKGKRK